jgi:hypothetical protein
MPETAAEADAPDEAIRELRRKIAAAEDALVRRVVETVDALAARGHADRLIEPLRPRLNRLGVPHPLRFARLLFTPLDPLIVPSKHWRSGAHTLPRSMILPMTRLVEDAFGTRMIEIRKTLRGRTTADAALIAATGAAVWPDAAAVLAKAAMPSRWRETRLPEATFGELAARTAALLRQAPALDQLVLETANSLIPPDPRTTEGIVRAVRSDRADALPMLAILLISRLPEAAGLLHELAAARSLPGLKAAAEQAADLLLDRMATGDALPAYRGLCTFSIATRGIVNLLSELDHKTATRGRRLQIRGLRQQLDRDCRACFRTGMMEEFVTPLQTGTDGTQCARLEEAARGLRMLEAEGRRIGPATVYQEMMSEAVDVVRDLPAEAAIGLIDRVRLLEILAGSDLALALLERLGDPLKPEA